MAEINRFRATRLASARTGIPAADRSGEIIGQAISQAAGGVTRALMDVAEKQRVVSDTLDVMERGTAYENSVREITQQVKQNNIGNPTAAFEEFKVRANREAEQFFSPTDSGRRKIAMKRVVDGFDQAAVTDLSKWAVARNNQIIGEKFTGVLNNSTVNLRETVKAGAGVDALKDELLKMSTIDSVLGDAKSALVNVLRLTDPSASSDKIDKMVQQKLTNAYTNAQLQTNPGLLLAELQQGKFDDLPDFEGAVELRAAAESAFISQTKSEELGTAAAGVNSLQEIIRTSYGADVGSIRGDLQSVDEQLQASMVLLTDAERQKLTLAAAGPTEALANIDNKIEIIKMYQQSLRDTREIFLKNKYFKIEEDVLLEAQYSTNIAELIQTAGDDPDEKYIVPLFETTSKMISDYNKGKISKDFYSKMMITALPALQKAVKDGHTGFDRASEGFQQSFGQIESAVDRFISDDKDDPIRNTVAVSAYLNFWESYKGQINQGVEMRPEQYRILGQDAFVKSLLKHEIIPDSDRYLIENSDKEPYQRIDRASNRAIVITKTDGLYNVALRGIGREPEPAKEQVDVVTPAEVEIGKLPGVPTPGFPTRTIDVTPKRVTPKLFKAGDKPSAGAVPSDEQLIKQLTESVKTNEEVEKEIDGERVFKFTPEGPEEKALIGQVTEDELNEFRRMRKEGVSFNEALKTLATSRQKRRQQGGQF